MPLIDRLDRVAVDQVRQVYTGQSLLLTGDTNLIEVSLSVQYTIADPEAYLFNIRLPDQLVTREAEAAIRQAVAGRGVDDLLTTGRTAILEQTRSRTQELLDEHNTGLRITDVQLLAVSPPTEVAPSFLDVASAHEDKNTFINEALAYRGEVVPTARGEAARIGQAAQAEKQRKIDLANGEATRFVDKLVAYQAAPEVTRTRLYLEALEQVLPNIKKFIVDPTVQTDSTELWLANGESAK